MPRLQIYSASHSSDRHLIFLKFAVNTIQNETCIVVFDLRHLTAAYRNGIAVYHQKIFTVNTGYICKRHKHALVAGNQATNYATSNNLASEGNSEYNAGVQQMNQDMILWNDISSLQIEIVFAQNNNNEAELAKLCNQLFYKMAENVSETMAAKIDWNTADNSSSDPQATILAWLEKENSMSSPFFDENYVNSYFTKANELLAQSQEVLEQGQKDNSNGDAFGLVTVIYSVVLFLLGIAGSFNHKVNKYAVVIIALVAFVIATIYMFTLPMPTGFSITSFFKG